ncbi:MAG: ABC transporter substrate-binding protein [Chloroflexi bacterium]|nr:ABC transporter substrate-binding protein [Chloroflexota bacterium]
MIKRLRVWWIVGVLLTALLVGAACTSDDNGDGEDATATSAPTNGEAATATPFAGTILTPEDVLRKDGTATQEIEIEWGWMFEQSGPLQGFGIPTGDGVLLAVQEINDAGGFQIGDTIYTIKLIQRDTESTVPSTIAAATGLVRDDEVNVIWGPATVGEPQATLITQDAQVLHLCPCQERETTALRTVEQAQGESRWAFQTLLPFSLLISQGARNFVVDWPEFKTMATLCVNTQNGQDICSRTAEAYAAAGIEVVGEEYFPEGTTDYNPFLTKLRGADPDYLFNFDDPLKQATIIQQAMELGVGRLHIASLPANLIETLVGIPLTTPVIAGAAARQCAQPTSDEAADYCERYKAFKGGTLPVAEFVSLMTYDYTYMLVAAMQQAGTVEDTTAISQALETLHYDGVSEDDMFFNSRHLGVHGTDPCIVVRDEPLTCQHVAPPPEAAE